MRITNVISALRNRRGPNANKHLVAKDPGKHTVGGGWGDHISWLNDHQFDSQLSMEKVYKVYGHKHEIPKVGDLLKAEFVKNWMFFVFIEVRPCADPHDMFFASVKIVGHNPKRDGTAQSKPKPSFSRNGALAPSVGTRRLH